MELPSYTKYLWNKKKLEIQLNFMIENKLKIYQTNYKIINENDKIIGKFN